MAMSVSGCSHGGVVGAIVAIDGNWLENLASVHRSTGLAAQLVQRVVVFRNDGKNCYGRRL